MKRACTSQLSFLIPHGLIRFVLYVAGLVLAFSRISHAVAGDNGAAEIKQSVPAQAPGKWRATGDLATGRELHAATLLPNGQVLVSGVTSNYGHLTRSQLYKTAPETLDVE